MNSLSCFLVLMDDTMISLALKLCRINHCFVFLSVKLSFFFAAGIISSGLRVILILCVVCKRVYVYVKIGSVFQQLRFYFIEFVSLFSVVVDSGLEWVKCFTVCVIWLDKLEDIHSATWRQIFGFVQILQWSKPSHKTFFSLFTHVGFRQIPWNQ